MDEQTREVYERQAGAIFARHVTVGRQLQRDRMLAHLHPGQPTADVGSGSGVDLAWLVSQGFPAIGYEPVDALRALAIANFPGIEVRNASLPDLEEAPDEGFVNVVCSAVLMHLPLESIPPSIASLARIMRPGGRLLLTYRTSNNQLSREDDGRLFTPISPDLLDRAMTGAGLRVLNQETDKDESRPGVTWSVIMSEKSPPPQQSRAGRPALHSA